MHLLSGCGSPFLGFGGSIGVRLAVISTPMGFLPAYVSFLNLSLMARNVVVKGQDHYLSSTVLSVSRTGRYHFVFRVHQS